MISEEEKQLIKKIEELNYEYLSSREYNIGNFIKYIMGLIKKRKFINVFKLCIMKLKKKKNKKNSNLIEKSSTYVIKKDNPFKIAIYTCITGDYDEVMEPLIAESGCDYILYTNNSKLKSEIWNIRNIPNNIANMDNARINRYIKMHPKELFPDYDYAIYIDGNVKIISIISSLIEKINQKTGLAIHRHCARKCIYEEAKACKKHGKGKYSKLKKQIKRYKNENFPKYYGMLECNMIIFDLNNKNSTYIAELWWQEYLNSESMRDQIALPYILWKNTIKIEDIGNLGDNINKNYRLKINSHN